ncbi:MAG TPA: DUF58 domain-containing protein [Noviherbaspirillum sp.]
MNGQPDEAVGIATSLRELIALRDGVRKSGTPRATKRTPLPGNHAAARRSRGMEFAEARLYRPGDDVRHIDWRQTARRGKAYTKLFQEELERPVSLLVDLGPSMRFGTRAAFKSVAAARAAAMLAWTAATTGDRIGGVVWNGATHHEVRPQSRHHGALALLRAVADTSADRPERAGDLAQPMRALARTLRPGSTVILISDFSTLGTVSGGDIAALGAHADVVLLHVYDVFEAEAPPPGRYRVTDGRQAITLDLRAESARHAYVAGFLARRAELERLARLSKARLCMLATHDDPCSVAGLLSGRSPFFSG